jgi:hypothetical protein
MLNIIAFIETNLSSLWIKKKKEKLNWLADMSLDNQFCFEKVKK